MACPPSPPAAPRPPDGLQDEIRMVRRLMRQVESLAQEGHTLGELLDLLDTISKASTRLATLLKAERALMENRPDGASLSDALGRVLRQMRLDEAPRSDGR